MKAKKDYALFLGCVIPNRYSFIEKATRTVMSKLGINFVEMEGAGCCPAPGVFKSFDEESWLILGARNLTIAEDMDLNIASMCNGCYGSLTEVNHELLNDSEKRTTVNNHLSKIDRKFQGKTNVKHVLEIFIEDIGLEKIQRMAKYGRKNRLDLNAAVHYGCHILKPSHLRPWNNEVEVPRFFDDIIEATGCTSVDYRDKLMCCGAGGGVRSAFKEVSLDMTREKLENMVAAGADVIVTGCPFCHLQFDLGQVEINSMYGDELDELFNIPVVYFTQLIGLAIGMTPEEVGLTKDRNLTGIPPFTPIEPLISKIGE
jgi:heterodisulfide reductase subunit B